MRNVLVKYIFGGLMLMVNLSLHAQKVEVTGGFIEDSLKIGENIHYWMKATYPKQLDVILPDSNYTFAPFEYAEKYYVPSVLREDEVTDSAVYTLQSYEIDPVQYLSLTAYVINKGDSIKISVDEDSIYFQELVPQVSDTTQLKQNLSYQDANTITNYPLILIILGLLIVIALVILLVFGGRIRKYLKLRKLRKEYEKFSERLTVSIRQLKNAADQKEAELALVEWKSFLETLEERPYTKLTTKEIMSLGVADELKESLRNIDRCVYGGVTDETLYKDFQSIEDYTQHRYMVVTEEIKNN